MVEGDQPVDEEQAEVGEAELVRRRKREARLEAFGELVAEPADGAPEQRQLRRRIEGRPGRQHSAQRREGIAAEAAATEGEVRPHGARALDLARVAPEAQGGVGLGAGEGEAPEAAAGERAVEPPGAGPGVQRLGEGQQRVAPRQLVDRRGGDYARPSCACHERRS